MQIAGVTVQYSQDYKNINLVGWTFCLVGSGLLTLLSATSKYSLAIGVQIPISAGLGLLYTATSFPVLAGLPPRHTAYAMSFHSFADAFGQVIGIAVGTTTLSNGLSHKLPTTFSGTLHGGPSATYAQIGTIKNL